MKQKNDKTPWPADAVSRRAVSELVPYARNARTHSDAQVAQIAASIREWGWTMPCLVDEDGGLIAGHGRILAAQRLGLEDVPCITASGWSEAKKRAYILADNQLAIKANWDWDMLALELADLQADGFDLDLIGFDGEELERMLGGMEGEGEGEEGADTEPEIDRAEELRQKWGVETGQLWQLSKHRLLCGDSTKAEDVARVMGGEVADACITDPPYGINHNLDYTRFTGKVARNKTKGVLKNDDKPFDPDPFLDFDAVVLWGANCYSNRLPMGTWLVWDKRFKNGTAFLSDAEVAWMKSGHGVYIHAITSQGFVRPESVSHPTQKPVKLIEWCIDKAKAGVIIFEPFSGSGTTLIACENLKRQCRAIEISPAYVAVALERWHQHTGLMPTLIGGPDANLTA